jgi:hypothetical protein
MPKEDSWGDECFYCDECGNAFRTPLFCISKSVEQMHFYEAPRLPEAEVFESESIANFCSSACVGKARNRVLSESAITATYPGPVQSKAVHDVQSR